MQRWLAMGVLCLAGCSADPGEAPSGSAAVPEPGAPPAVEAVQVMRIQQGTGASPGPTDVVRVHYHGTLSDGSVFDSSVERGEPASFALDRVIRCWTDAFPHLKVGDKARLVCPPDSAYGARGSPPRIPPDATLYFEVELLGIE